LAGEISAHQILSALFPDQPAFLEAFDELLGRLEFGLRKGALKLINLRVALSRGQYLGLFAAGAGTVDVAHALDQDTLVRRVGSDAANSFAERRRSAVVRDNGENTFFRN
jgi:hypothetical protein